MRNFRLLSPFVGTKVPPFRDDSEREDFPEEKAGWYSKATWSWLNPLMKVSVERGGNGEGTGRGSYFFGAFGVLEGWGVGGLEIWTDRGWHW